MQQGSDDDDEESKMSIFQLKRNVIEMCSRIFRVIGPGFREAVYEKALVVELNLASVAFVSQAPVPIYYKGTSVGVGYADIIVDNQLVLELKAAKTPISPGNMSQCRGYMRSLHLDHGLVINFCQYRSREQDIEVYDCFLAANYPVKGPPQDKEAELADGPGVKVAPADVTPYSALQMECEELDGGVTPINRRAPVSFLLPSEAKPKKRKTTSDVDGWFDFTYADGSTSVSVKKQ